MKKLLSYQEFINESYPITEDWFDEIMKYAEDVMAELQKRFVMSSSQKGHLIDFFLDQIEKGYKKKIKPPKLALILVPKDQQITIWEDENMNKKNIDGNKCL